jgi:hypothetical protein
MKFLEKDLEQIIFEADKNRLINRGINLFGNQFRQLRIGNYGVADLVYVKRPYYHTYFNDHCKGEITIVELKQKKISISAFLQALNYAKGIRRYLEKNKESASNFFNFRIVLIGSEIDLNSSVIYLNDFFKLKDKEYLINDDFETIVELYTYKYDFDGIFFKEENNYSLVKELF